MICLICNLEFESRRSLCNHLSKKHKLLGKEYFDQFLKTNIDGICKLDGCNNHTKFINLDVGYSDCCCLEHTNLFRYGVKSNLNLPDTKKKAQKNSHTKEAIQKQAETNIHRYGGIAPMCSGSVKNKSKQTCITRYGVDNAWKSKEIKEKCSQTKLNRYGDANYNNREKAKSTVQRKYGVDHQMKSESVKDKVKRTNNERYGTDYYTQTDDFKLKVKKTCNNKYGTDYYVQSNEFKEKSKKTNIKHFNVDNPHKSKEVILKAIQTIHNKQSKFEKDNNCTSISTLIDLYGQGFLNIKDELTILHLGKYTFISNNDIPRIVEYSSKHNLSRRSYQENQIYKYVKSLCSDAINNSRKVISPYELDIFIPSKNVAIEYNGNYWHSSNIKNCDKYGHLHKTELCQLQNIRLIHIFEWEWANRQEICKSIISSALGIYKQKIYARKCIVKEVSSKDAKQFLEENHIQGSINSSHNYGLYYNNELVQLICIGKSRFKKDEYELLRMCTKLYTQVIGGFSKLMKHQPYNIVYSYIDRSKFTGFSYDNIGFEIINITDPSYTYYKNNIKLNRISAQKHKLSKLLGESFDSTKTEIENMTNAGWLQVYDCGNIKVKYTKGFLL